MKGSRGVQSYTVAVRAYAVHRKEKGNTTGNIHPLHIGHSEWALIFDTETTTDPAQKLRFGNYQLRRHDHLEEEGFFYDPETLTQKEIQTLQDYAESREITLLTVDEFVEEVFFYYAYDLSALCIGFNLPFDLSRLAIRQSTAKKWRGAFSFALSENSYRPRVRVKHLNARASLIEFTKPRSEPLPQSYRKADLEVPPHRGYFLDVKTLASALLFGRWSLKSLADHLKTDNRKIETDEHGATLTPEYLDYAARDVQVTWECFEILRIQYERYGLKQTAINQISLGQVSAKPTC